MDTINLSEDQQEAVINCGAFGYELNQIANIIDIDLDVLLHESQKKDSQFNKLLKKGQDMFEYKMDTKLLEMANSGDISALRELEKRKDAKKFPNI